MKKQLRPHQTRAIDLLKQAIRSGKRRPMLSLPTGAGKTLTAAAIIEGARAKGNRVCFTVPAIELIDQTVAALEEEGILEVGVIQADHPRTDPDQPVQVASVQTLASRKNWPDTDLVIVDEAHVAYQIIEDWMKAKPDTIFVGLSATPWTRGLAKKFDHLIVAASISELIRAGYLSPFEVYAPTHPDLAGVKTVAGDYNEKQLSAAMNRPELTADVVKTWLKKGKGLPTLCFGVDRAHAQSLCRDFRAAGVKAAYVDGDTPRDERDAIRDAFHAGEIEVVCNIGVLTTGVDWDVRCLILARPTKSEVLFVQIVGRALRTAPGKKKALILDHSDTTLKLGLVADISYGRLDDGSPKPKAVRGHKVQSTVMECPDCSLVRPKTERHCPACGPKIIQAAPGKLLKFGEESKRRRKSRKSIRTEHQRFWSGLLWIQLQRGYSRNWALAQFKKRFDDWPNGCHDRAKADVGAQKWVMQQQEAWAAMQRLGIEGGR